LCSELISAELFQYSDAPPADQLFQHQENNLQPMFKKKQNPKTTHGGSRDISKIRKASCPLGIFLHGSGYQVRNIKVYFKIKCSSRVPEAQ